MDKIKKFFEKKKADAKFKLAGIIILMACFPCKICLYSWIGEGHKLNEPTVRGGKPGSSLSQHHAESVPNAAKQQAAAAAVARLDQKKKDLTPQQRSAALIRAQAFKELELEKDENAALQKLTIKNKETLVPQLAVSGVFYKCPLIGTFIGYNILCNKLIWSYSNIFRSWSLTKKGNWTAYQRISLSTIGWCRSWINCLFSYSYC